MPEIKSSGRIGLIGLGIIGSRVARLLGQSGQEVWVWNRTPHPVPRFVGCPSDLTGHAEILLIFLKDGPVLLECLEKMKPSLSGRHVVVNHATVAPAEAKKAAELVQATGASFLNAPFTGSRDAAAAGQLVYYVGGDSTVLERVRPVLAVTAKAIIPLGLVEQAAAVKLATNLMAASVVAGLAEAWALARYAGVGPEAFGEAMAANAARSGTSDLKFPCMVQGDYAPRFSLDNMVKDIRLVAQLAEEAGVTSRQSAAFLEAATPALQDGLGDRDFSVIFTKLGSGVL